jgi:hypothetical protein
MPLIYLLNGETIECQDTIHLDVLQSDIQQLTGIKIIYQQLFYKDSDRPLNGNDELNNEDMYLIERARIPIPDNTTLYELVDKWIRPRLRNDKKKIIETYGSIEDWDTSQITNMKELFMWEYDFNDDISQWDVSKVTDMTRMFYSAERFNKDLSQWNMENVRDMTDIMYDSNMFRLLK